MSQPRPSATASIRFLTGPLSGQTVRIERDETTLGRDTANDIVISGDLRVSRQHARITWHEGAWEIENRSQTSFITVDRVGVERAPLVSGAEITLGDVTRFVFVLAEDERSAEAADQRSLDERRDMPPAAVQTGERPAAELSPQPDAGGLAVAALAGGAEQTQLASPLTLGLPSLVVSSTSHSEKQTYLLDAPSIDIGRDSGNDIVLNDRIVSGKHLRLVRQGNAFVLQHPHPDRERTMNGLLYQGRKIRGDERFSKVLMKGDFFRIGDEDGTLLTLTYDDGTGTTPPEVPSMAPIKLDAPELTIGRLPDNRVVLSHLQVSAHHARLIREGATYRIDDLNSTNHVYVNAEAVSSRMLKTGDEIRIGPYRLVYDGNQLRQYDERSFIRIDALHLKKYGGSRDHRVPLLDDITLTIPPRTFVALVGGSGAGKSTLLDALNGLRPAHEGSVLYNGEHYYSHLSAFSTQLGYVPQDDIVHGDLTVERALYYAARLRLPSDFTREQIDQRITEVLDDVELSGRRDLLVKKLSGGQRKRVSIALELLGNPSIFFLDEPTSGLDPGLDRKMMLLLRNLADRGHTVVLVTHATSNITTCDYVCFLAAGGRLAYFGPPDEARTYFGKANFAEIYSSLEPTDESPDAPEKAEARFRSSPEYQRYVLDSQHTARTDTAATVGQPGAATGTAAQKARTPRKRAGWSQFVLLSTRYVELLKNDTVNLLLLLLQAPIVALLLVVMLRFEVGAGIFNATSLVQCRSQIVTPSGQLALPQAQHAVQVDCQQVLTFLRTSPNGQAYASQRGGANQALQDFILPGPGADAQKALFILSFTTILFGCINGAREFVKESAIYRRERTVNLGIAPYMFSKIVVLGILCLYQSAVLVVAMQLVEPFQQGILLPPVLETYVTLCLTSLAGLMIGLAISAIAPNADRAISFVPIILLPQVIFSGAIIPLKDWFTQILAAIFPSRWAMAALGSSIGLHADALGGDRLFGNDYSYHSTLFSIYNATDAAHRLLWSWGVLVAISLVLMGVIAVFLKRKDTVA